MKLEMRHKILILVVLLAAGFFFVLPELSFMGFQPATKPTTPEMIEGQPLQKNLEKIPTH